MIAVLVFVVLLIFDIDWKWAATFAVVAILLTKGL